MAEDTLSPGRPSLSQRIAGIFQFCRTFIELTIIISILWWLAIPAYGYAVAQLSAGILVNALGVPVEGAWAVPHGILNTESVIVFLFGGREIPFPIVKLVTNMAPYLALVLATPRLGVLRRLVILFTGALILAIGHVAFVVLAFHFRQDIAKAPDVPLALAELYLTLPFVLWIVLAYWGKIARYLTEEENTAARTGEN
jgi:hypothetical protein